MQNRDSNWRHFLGDRCRIVRCDPVPGRIFTSERLLWALAVVIGIELLVSQVISWEVSVWVFESEESGEKIFHNDERSRQVGGDAFQAFDDNEQYTDQDTTDKNHVEQLPRRGVRFEDDDV